MTPSPRRSGPAPLVAPDPRTPRQVSSTLRKLITSGASLRPAGSARHAPDALLRSHPPRHAVGLFGHRFFLTDFRFDDALNFFVAYVVPPEDGKAHVYPRVFYKDVSLIWRVASHYVHTEDEYWIGKGAMRTERLPDGELYECSAEETTNLPYELQAALDTISRRSRPTRDDRGVEFVLRKAPGGRIAPYADFSEPRRRARADRAIHRGRYIARFTRRGDPASLTFAPGYEPDLKNGLVETSLSASRLYGGELRKHRILSSNGTIQYQFVESPSHCWVNPPQAVTSELSTYGVRVVDVRADDDVFVPGYEYHFLDDSTDPPSLHTQIPEGFAGEPSELDPSRADASRWIEALPIVREFRKRIAGPRS